MKLINSQIEYELRFTPLMKVRDHKYLESSRKIKYDKADELWRKMRGSNSVFYLNVTELRVFMESALLQKTRF